MAFAEYASYDGLGLAGLVRKGDVTPLERYLAAYLLSQSVQQSCGTSWQDAMAAHRVADDRDHWWDTDPASANCIGVRAGAR